MLRIFKNGMKIKDVGEEQIKEVEDFVISFFNQDIEKARLWFSLPNPMLGGAIPYYFMTPDKIQVLLNYMDDANQANSGEAL